ncbi:MAG: DUF58 domain-containing protein [Anaerolineae bacterium]|jgi:uncharacterized protein (DUF58 family)
MFRRQWWVLLGILLLLGLILHSSLFFLFVILLGIASGTSALWSRYCLNAVTYRRSFSDNRIFYGEETRLTIEVTNAKPLPLAWLLIRDSFPKNVSLLTGELETEEGNELEEQPDTDPPRSPAHLTDILALRWYERVRRTYRIRGDNRGLYQFGPASLSSGDLFGFGRKSATYEAQDCLIVYPRLVPVEQLGMPAERPAGERKAKRRIIEDPLRMATVREYIPGDSIRYIHWKNTARLNQLQTKVFDPSASHILVIFLDLQTAANPYGLIPEYLELAITSAGSLALHSLEERYAVGLYANGGPRNSSYWTIVRPGRSPGQGTQILDALAPLFGFRLLPMHQLLRRSMPTLPFGSTAMVISACMTEDLLVSMLAVQDAGHPVVLLTVGDTKPDVPDTFVSYHLGGRDAWHHLQTLELD